jgi:hypothetical protein
VKAIVFAENVVSWFQELRQMEQIGSAAENGRRGTIFAQESPLADQSHLKTEIVLMQRKYERLLQKERRMIVSRRLGKNTVKSVLMVSNNRQ